MLSEYATSEPAPEPRPGPTGQPLRLRPVDEVGDDQEVARKAHLQDRLDLEVEPRDVARPLALAHRRVGIELREARLEALVRGDPEVLGHRHARAVDERRLEVGQLRLAEDQAQVAALGDLDRVARARSAGRRRAPPSAPAS